MQVSNFEFQLASKERFNCTERSGETRLWEKWTWGAPTEKTQFVILGIAEDIGPQMNFGLPGAKNGIAASLEKLGHQQSNQYLTGEDITILGIIHQKVDFDASMIGTSIIEELDELVRETIDAYLLPHHQLIVIGGGHNNALPLLRSSFARLNKLTDIVNIDPHADCREMSYRHSGNPFSFAATEGLLKKYHVLGLHEGYNNTFIYDFLKSHNFTFQTFESKIDNAELFGEEFQRVLSTYSNSIGFEIDLDSIQQMPVSAYTPSGFSLDEIRKLVRNVSSQKKVKYLHLPESAPMNAHESTFVSKSIAYLVADFIKCSNKNK